MILFTGMHNVVDASGTTIVNFIGEIPAGAGYTQAAIETFVPGFGVAFVAVALFFFAFTTIMA